MSQNPIPPPPDSLPEQPGFRAQSKYQRSRQIVSWWGLLFGTLVGAGVGLYLAWAIFPVVETDTRPNQLQEIDTARFVVAVALNFSYDSDLNKAITHLSQLDLGPDPLQAVAYIACDLARSGYVDSTAGLRAVRAMRTFYQLQGRSGCADTLIPEISTTQIIEIDVPTPTATLPPPPTKTPAGTNATPTPSGIVVVPTTAPQRQYEGRPFGTFCSLELNGIIEIYVREIGGTQGIPGERIRVQWEGGSSTFVSGLKPERDPGYADFQMEAGLSYLVSMPGLSDPITPPLLADGCTTDNGEAGITSYRVSFVRSGG